MDKKCGQELTESSNKAMEHRCEPCLAVYDKDNVNSVGFCVQCVEYMCELCANHHQKSKATRTHDLLTGNEIPESKAPFQMLEVIGKCPNHSEEVVTYECKDHGQFLCVNCVKTDHMHCPQLTEIAFKVSDEIDKSKLSETLLKIEENAAKCEALVEKKRKNLDIMTRQRDEILARQSTLKLKLEKVLKDLQKQEDQVNESFAGRLSKLSTEINTLTKLQNRNQLVHQFAQATSKYALPSQLYIVANGHFEHISDELISLADNEEVPDFRDNMTDVKHDILNLFLAVEVSKEICENSSDEYLDTQLEAMFDLPGQSSEPACPEHLTEDKKKAPILQEQSLMGSEVKLSNSHTVSCKGDAKPCDVVGIAIVASDLLHVVTDYANTKVKVFDHNFKFLHQKPLQSRPCSICKLKHNQIAVLLVDKIIAIFNVSKIEVQQVNIFRLDMYGHCVIKYGNNLAVMCSESKFQGNFESTSPSISVKIVDPVNGNTLSSLANFLNRGPNHGKKIKLIKPCQIYSRYGTELIIGTDNGIKVFDADGVQKWFFSREHVLKGTTGITSDTDNNLYVCGFGSNNIHQVFSLSYTYTKVIIEEIQCPWALAYDQSEKKLVVGCRNTNSVFVYKFTYQ